MPFVIPVKSGLKRAAPKRGEKPRNRCAALLILHFFPIIKRLPGKAFYRKLFRSK